MIKNIFFDFDGTMVDTRQDILESWQYIFKKLKNTDVDEEFLKDTFGEPLRLSLSKFFPDVPLEESIGVYREYLDSKDGEERFKLFPQIYGILESLYSKGICLGVVTSRGSNSTNKGLLEMGIDKFFSVIITADMVEKTKPSGEPILKALQEIDGKAEETIMIGDTIFDLMAAKEAGVIQGLVAWAELKCQDDELKENDLDPYIFADISDFERWI